jgi:hypothetical protein
MTFDDDEGEEGRDAARAALVGDTCCEAEFDEQTARRLHAPAQGVLVQS